MSRLGEPVLRVKKALWRQNDPEADGRPVVPAALRPKILERDDYTCGHCGFRSLKWQEIHHKDDDHANNDPSNLETLCPWCHGCHHVGFMGVSGKAILVWLPEMTQTGLFHLVRILGVAMVQDKKDETGLSGLAKKQYEELGARRKVIDGLWGDGSANPAVLGNILLDAEEGAIQEPKLSGFRLLPDLSRWIPQISYWSVSVFGAVPVGTWNRLAEKWSISRETEIEQNSEDPKKENIGVVSGSNDPGDEGEEEEGWEKEE